MTVRTVESLLARCKADGDCMLWQGSTNMHGAPTVHLTREDGTRQVAMARRVLYLLLGRTFRRGHPYVSVSCTRQRCMAPDHLVDVNRSESLALAARAGRLNLPQRTVRVRAAKRTAPDAKLTMDKAREIRRRHTEGAVAMDLAREYGVHFSLIYLVVRHKRWKEHADNSSVFCLGAGIREKRAA